MERKEVDDLVKAARDYLSALKSLENEVKVAEEQIESSALETEDNISISFSNLLESITKTLEMRRNRLLQKTKTVKDKSLKPLRDCRKLILNKIHATENFVLLGEKIAKGKHKCDNEFNTNASFLGSLPEVPALNEVPCISYLCEASVCRELVETCSSFGSVSSIAPIQICSLLEKPGSILIEWHCIESEETLTDIQEFRLQKACGNVLINKHLLTNFNDCYMGPDSQYLAKDLQINQSYTFRVCCKFEGCSSWSSWSLPQVSETTIKAFSWENNENFSMRNENKIAKPLNVLKTILFSDGPQFHVGYSIEFTFLECDSELNGTYVGISYTNTEKNIEGLMKESFLVETNGDIYINGVKKGTKLPQVNVTSKICFTCNQLGDAKILVNVDCCDKRVTYDWTLSNEDVLYFFASFKSTKWKVMVE